MEPITYSFAAQGNDEETRLLAVIDNALQLLEPAQRGRILRYLIERHV